VQLIWQTGKLYASKAAEKSYLEKSISGPMSLLLIWNMRMHAADVVVSRSGAMAIAELCVAGRAAVFVPFPFAAEDHQTVNAETLVSKQAGLMVKDSEAKEKLVSTVLY
jgi:UDP-N-acetylglucosamine--N-acetylmuramyl-(pentapeptide) pyrophosphoryl-undecaprenol N-acetylglucosamine transferase